MRHKTRNKTYKSNTCQPQVGYFLCAQRSFPVSYHHWQWAPIRMLCIYTVLQHSAGYRAHEVNPGEICSSKCLEMSRDLAGGAGDP